MSIDLGNPTDLSQQYRWMVDGQLLPPSAFPAGGAQGGSPTVTATPPAPLVAQQGDDFELSDHLPDEVKEALEGAGVDVEGVDTPFELRQLLQQLNQSEGSGDPLEAVAKTEVDSPYGDMDVSELLAMLIDYLEQGYHQQDQAPSRQAGTMGPSNFGNSQPAPTGNWPSPSGGGASGGGTSGGGAPGAVSSAGATPSTAGVQGAADVGSMQNLSAEQKANAQTIIDVGKQMGASDRDIQIALMTAMQESGLRNLNHGDRDSQGLFQQRPSQGWGTVEQITTPEYAAGKFYEGLLRIGNRDQMRMTQAAQAVQRSAFPEAYAKHEGVAAALVEQYA